MRYLFIVQEKKVEAFGKKKVKRIFHILAILLPLIMMIWSITNWETFSDHTETTAYWLINVDHGQIFILQTFTIVNS